MIKFNVIYVSCLFWSITILSLTSAQAQSTPILTCRFESDTVEIKSGQSFSNKIYLTNHSSRPVTLKSNASHTKAQSGLIKLPDTIKLQPNESKVFPLKYIANRNTINSFIQPFTIVLTEINSNTNFEFAKSFYSKLNQQNLIHMTTDQHEYYFDQATHDVKFNINISNMGLIPMTFKIVFSEIPKGLEFIGEKLPITLLAGAEMMFSYSAKNMTPKVPMDFNVLIQAVDNDANTLSSNRVRLVTIGSEKRIGFTNTINDIATNSFALRYMNMNEIASNYQLQANGSHAIQNSTLSYRLHMDYFQNQEIYTLYDSYLQYERKKWGIKLGNIYENLDHHVSGRGIKASYQINTNKTINFYGIERNYFIVGTRNDYESEANIVAAEYKFSSPKIKNGQIVYIHNTNNKTENTLDQISSKFTLIAKEKNTLEIENGYSIITKHNQQQQHGFSAGINYHHTYNDIQLQILNYYSSPYFTGIRRGFLQSDIRISKHINDRRLLTARASIMRNQPKFFDTGQDFYLRTYNQIQQYEIGYTQSFGTFNINAMPYLLIQHSNNNVYNKPLSNISENWISKSLRGMLSINFQSPKHRFSINTDYGFTYMCIVNNEFTSYHSWRINSNYSNKYIGMNAFIQINPYYLSDHNNTSQDKRYQIYSFGPNTQFSFFKNQLNIQLSMNYSFYRMNNTRNITTNGTFNWKLFHNLDFNLDFNYAKFQHLTELPDYGMNTFSNRQFRLSIVKKFDTASKSQGYKLELVYYEDSNNNGMRDSDETKPAGILVKIENNAAITDGKGKVTFTNMKEGLYTVQIQNNYGWIMNGVQQFMIHKNQTIEIPLVKKKMLKGKINVLGQKYLQAKPTLSGIRINAKDEHGNVYKTYTDDQGMYVFFLPTGKYNVFIETEGLVFSIENAYNEINLNEKATFLTLDFIYKDLRRKVDIKTF